MPQGFDFRERVVWQPTQEYIERSNLRAFMDQNAVASLAELTIRSSADVAWFTTAVLDFLDIRFHRPYEQIVDLSRGIQFPEWCVGGGLNIAANCLDKWLSDPESAARPAIISELEDGSVHSLTYLELAAEVNRCANALRGLGFAKGDVVGLFMPMTNHVVVALLALARIGAVALPLFSGFGAGAIAARLNDAGARGLFTSDNQCRRGAVVPMKTTADEALLSVPSVHSVIVSKRVVDSEVPMTDGRDHWWHEIVPSQSPTATYEPTSAEDLLMIIYTSGTTGAPKGAVHTHCGFPVKAAQDMAFGTDVHAGDVVYWMTDMGWMMGPWLVYGSCLLGATCVVYDGGPDYPAADRLWRLVERHRIDVMGLSPTLVRSLIIHGEEPFASCDLSSLRLFASTGEPWNHDPWRWLFERVGECRCPIINYSGGTEISGGIVMGNTLQPLKPTAFAGPCPGIAADVVDEQGHSCSAGNVGELVIRAPWIGMTRGFWNDPDRYLQTYWSRWEDVWVHGDWAAIDEDGMWYLLGRSDDTINVAGKRVGPTEFESVLVSHHLVAEAGAIGVPDDIKGARVVCFCVLYDAGAAGEGLREELVNLIATELGKPLRPSALFFVADLPKTRNAKVMRRIIRSAYLGEPPGDTSSLVNPEALEGIRQIAESVA